MYKKRGGGGFCAGTVSSITDIVCPLKGNVTWYTSPDLSQSSLIFKGHTIPISEIMKYDSDNGVKLSFRNLYTNCSFMELNCKDKIEITYSCRVATPEEATAACATEKASFRKLMTDFVNKYLEETKSKYQKSQNVGLSLANCIVNALKNNSEFVAIQGANFNPNVGKMSEAYFNTGIKSFLDELTIAFVDIKVTYTAYNDIQKNYNKFKTKVDACFDPNPTSTNDVMAYENPYSCDVSQKGIDYQGKTVFMGYNGNPIDVTTCATCMPLKFCGSEMVGHEGQLYSFQVNGKVYLPIFNRADNFLYYGYTTSPGTKDPSNPTNGKIYSSSQIEKYTNPGGTSAVPIYLKTDSFGYYYFTDGNTTTETFQKKANLSDSNIKVLSECRSLNENICDYNSKIDEWIVNHYKTTKFSSATNWWSYSQESRKEIFDRYVFNTRATNTLCPFLPSNERFITVFSDWLNDRETQIKSIINNPSACNTLSSDDIESLTSEDLEQLPETCRVELLIKIESNLLVPQNKEKIVFRLLRSGQKSPKSFIEKLRDQVISGNNFLKIFGRGTDDFSGSSYFTKGMNIITDLCKKSYDWYTFDKIQKIQDEGLTTPLHLAGDPLIFPLGWDNQKQGQQIYYDANFDVVSFSGKVIGMVHTTQKYLYKTIQGCSFDPQTQTQVCVYTTNKENYEGQERQTFSINDPYLPIGIYFHENTPSFLTEKPGTGTLKIVPAYYLYYYGEKQRSNNIEKVVDAELTVLSMAIGVGEISTALRTGQRLRAMVATADLALDLANLGILAADVNNRLDSKTRSALQILNVFGTLTTFSVGRVDTWLKNKEYQKNANTVISAVQQIEEDLADANSSLRTRATTVQLEETKEQLFRVRQHLLKAGYSLNSILDALQSKFLRINYVFDRITGIIKAKATNVPIGKFENGLLTLEKNGLSLVDDNSKLIGSKIEDFPEITRVTDDGIELPTNGVRIDNTGRCTGNGSYCFTEDTPTETGELMTNKKVGDLISTINPTTGERVMATLKKVKHGITTQLTSLMIAGTLLNVTPAHALQNEVGEWIPASELHTGDRLRTPTGTVEVQDVCTERVPITPVVSFELEDDLPYFVGNAKVLALSTCDLKTIYNLFGDINKRISFKGLVQRIEKVGGNHSGFISKLASNGFTEAEIGVLSDAFRNLDDINLKAIVDDFAAGSSSYQSLFKSTEAVDAWVSIAVYSRKRTDATILSKTIGVLLKKHISRSDLKTICTVNDGLGSRATGLSDFLDDLDNFALYKNQIGFSKVIDNLKKDWFRGAGADGANWIIAGFKKEGVSVFPPASTSFEVSASISGNTRYYDVVVGTIGNNAKYFEFKSVKTVPPGEFNKQFINDLNNSDVTNLSQIKWYFDNDKNPANFVTNMENAIDGLDNSLIANFLPKFGVNTPVQLKIVLKRDLNTIFLLK